VNSVFPSRKENSFPYQSHMFSFEWQTFSLIYFMKKKPSPRKYATVSKSGVG
jgi:hypothetical protein